MKVLKMNFWNLSVADQIQKARSIVEKMTGNPHFATPEPPLDDVSEAINRLEASHEAALDGGKTRKAAMYRDEDHLHEIIHQLSVYVQGVSKGREEIILSSGFEVRSEAVAARAPETPPEIRRVESNREGEVEIKWVPVKNARAYILQTNTNPSDEKGWTFLDVSCTANYTVRNLESVSVKWFRISAIGLKGRTDFSPPIKAVVR